MVYSDIKQLSHVSPSGKVVLGHHTLPLLALCLLNPPLLSHILLPGVHCTWGLDWQYDQI